jgi:hypothetical protein
MLPILFSFILLFSNAQSSGPYPELKEVKAKVKQSVNDAALAKSLYKQLSDYKLPDSHELYPYLACMETIMAKHTMNPFTRMNYLDKGMERYNEVLKKRPEDMTTRMLRLQTESAIPSFMGRNEHIKEDKTVLINYVRQQQSLGRCETVTITGGELLRLESLSAKEKENVKALVDKCKTAK